jgi:hypothetical protein
LLLAASLKSLLSQLQHLLFIQLLKHKKKVLKLLKTLPLHVQDAAKDAAPAKQSTDAAKK